MKGKPGEPILISWDDAETLFHEFGHALHGLSSNVNYPSLSGTSVARDYVEFPSQLLEHWLSTPEVLDRFALHFETGKPMPRELVEKIERADDVQPGLRDRRVPGQRADRHEAAPRRRGRRRRDRPRRVRARDAGRARHAEGDRHAPPHAAVRHIFSSDGYSAGYYSYLWADTLTADAWEAFDEAGGAYDKAVAEAPATTTSSRSATPSTRPRPTAPSAARTPASTP